ncbi:hypothetical protein PgNI_06233 [Pyricularia grisea]|uniref:Uncharacterized protein n=1 Tax=Pyricularia grisea TaxID=148305 RepID=A0A6P8B4V5_PYRGI|nr:hypothetical protein PgNI_06233 [Pyricularia grisea]TLD10290.1 hypothetical protein PgNI_06233 [Pyricularia grisea]
MLALLYSALLVSSAAANTILPFGTSTPPSFLQYYGGFTKPAAKMMEDKNVMIHWNTRDMIKEYHKTSRGSTHYIYLAYITSDLTTEWYGKTVGPPEEQRKDSEGRQGDRNDDVSYITADRLAFNGPWSWKHIRGWYQVEFGKAHTWHRNGLYDGPDFSDKHPEQLY